MQCINESWHQVQAYDKYCKWLLLSTSARIILPSKNYKLKDINSSVSSQKESIKEKFCNEFIMLYLSDYYLKMNSPSHVFVNFKTQEVAKAVLIHNALIRNGYDVWFQEDP